MSEEELKDIWMNAGKIKLDLPQLVVNLKGKMKKLDRALFFRDLREILAGIIVMCAFSYKAITDLETIAKVTSAMFVVWAGFGIYKILDVRKHKTAVDLSQSFKSQLLLQRHYLEQQAHLLNSIFSWYIGPFAVIYTIRVIGTSYTDPFWVLLSSIGFSLGFTYLLSWGIYALNKKAAKTAYVPLIENIDNVLLQLDEELI